LEKSRLSLELSTEISDLKSETVRDISDLSSLTFNTLRIEISDLSSDTSTEISVVQSLVSSEITDLSNYTSSELTREIVDLSNILHTRIYNDISNVIGGAGEALDTLKELEDYVTGLSGNTITNIITDLNDISGRETTHFTALSAEINDLSGRETTHFTALSTDINDISNAIPVIFNDLSDISVNGIATGKLVKWDGTSFTETELLYNKPSDGYIGIGTSNPLFPLTVNSHSTSNITHVGYLDQSGASITQSAQNSEISIYATKGIWTGTSFYASSDMRIKKYIVDLVPSACMSFVRKLKAKKYNFVDYIKNGSKEVYGFIAQDVEKICPNVVTKQQEFIPDVFKAVENITWTKIDKKWKLTILDDSIELKNNRVVRFYVSDRKNSEIMKDVKNCRYDSKSFLFDKIYEDIFIYGHQVNDFLALDKEQLFTLHHGAIQSLDTNQQTIENEIKTLKKENETLKTIIFTLQSQLENVISHLGINISPNI